MDRRVVVPGQFEGGRTQCPDLGNQPGDEAFVDPDGQRLGVLEEPVDPGVEVGRERHGGGVDAGAAGGVGDHRRRRPVAGRSRLVQVEPAFEFGHRRLDARAARAVRRQGVQQRPEPGQLFVEDPQVRRTAVPADPVGESADQVDRGDLAAAAAGAVSAGHRVVVAPVQQDALDVAAGCGRLCGHALGRVRELGQPLEAALQHRQQVVILLGGGEGLGSAHLDALQAAGALPRVDDGGEHDAGATLGLLRCVEQRTRPRGREGGDGGEHGAELR